MAPHCLSWLTTQNKAVVLVFCSICGAAKCHGEPAPQGCETPLTDSQAGADETVQSIGWGQVPQDPEYLAKGPPLYLMDTEKLLNFFFKQPYGCATYI